MSVRGVTTALAFAYPVVAHLAVARGDPTWVAAAIALLSVVVLGPALVRGRPLAWLSVPLIAAGCWLLARALTPVMLLYVAPVLVPAFMAWVFGHTLIDNRTPLIAQLIRVLHRPGADEPEAAVWSYARHLTFAWTGFFIALATINLTLATFAEPDGLLMAAGVNPSFTVSQYGWSLFANLIAYLLVAVFFVVEYAYRRRRFPQQPFRSMSDFIRQTGAAMPQLLRRDS